MSEFPEYSSQSELATILKCSQPLIHKYISQGKIPESISALVVCSDGKKRKKYKTEEAIRCLSESLDKSKSRKAKPTLEVIEQEAEPLKPEDFKPEIQEKRKAEAKKAGIPTDITLAEAQRLKTIAQLTLLSYQVAEVKGEVVKSKDEAEAGAAMAAEVKRLLLEMSEMISGQLADMTDTDEIALFLKTEIKKRLVKLSKWEKV